MAGLKVVRTYLEMTSPDQLRPAEPDGPLPRIERLEQQLARAQGGSGDYPTQEQKPQRGRRQNPPTSA